MRVEPYLVLDMGDRRTVGKVMGQFANCDEALAYARERAAIVRRVCLVVLAHEIVEPPEAV